MSLFSAKGFPLISLGIALLMPAFSVNAQSGFFDGDFESGTFQGWTPGGTNGGFATLAAKGTCFSSNDTTGVSLNGNQRSNYAALLRSNVGGGTDSIATLRSLPFQAGSAVYFSALTESPSAIADESPVEFIVRILDTSGNELAALPYRTALVELAPGCPSEQRDAAFSIHSVPTHQFDGEIIIEFSQSTRILGRGLFTLIDDVFTLPQDNIILSRSQPVAVAGTSVTNSGTLFLDPRLSFDPDGEPEDLNYRWRINDENFMRELDLPCVFLDGSISVGNNTATLYVDDGFHYAADTLNFVVPNGTTTNGGTTTDGSNTNTGTNTNTTANNFITLTAPRGGPVGSDTGSASSGGTTLTDANNQCDIDFSEIPATGGDNGDGGDGGDGSDDGDGTTGISIDLNGNDAGNNGDAIFAIGGSSVAVAPTTQITGANSNQLTQVVITLNNAQTGDALSVNDTDSALNVVIGNSNTTITVTPAQGTTQASSNFEALIRLVQFAYSVPDGDTPITTDRTVTVSVQDSQGASTQGSASVTIEVTN